LTRTKTALAIHRYFWPDTPPYASFLRAIAASWQAHGYQTEIFSTQPSYKPELKLQRRPASEFVDGVKVRRLNLSRGRSGPQRAFTMVSFTLAAFFVTLRKRRDLVMCSTTPPVILSAAVCMAARIRRSAFIYHCMDLHPEIGALSGEFKRRWIYNILMYIDTATCRRASTIVVLSADMRNSLVARDPTLADRTVVLNNFDSPTYNEHASEPILPETRNEGRLRLVFTGNLGRFQGLEAVAEGVLQTQLPIDLIFMGEGNARPRLQTISDRAPYAADVRIEVRPHDTRDKVQALIDSADLGIVSLTPGVIRYAYPSKTATYLSAGLPILVSVEADSELARTVADAQVGFSVPPENPEAIADALQMIWNHRIRLRSMAENAKDFALQHFGIDHALERWSLLADEVVEAQGVCA